MSTEITLENLEEISSLDLRKEAESALSEDESVEFYRTPYAHNMAINVETIFLGNGRAGQCVNGDAIWGDWHSLRFFEADNGEGTFRVDGSRVGDQS